jgi:NDP-sugar pyrophosphorylase family protein
MKNHNKNKMKVVILCGGEGKRLRPLTEYLPKTLMPIMGIPILQHIIEHFIRKGLKEFILCVGFKSDAIKKFIKSQNFHADIIISDAGVEASMLKRIYEAHKHFEERALITYGDTFIALEPHQMLEQHLKNRADISITVAESRSPFGHVQSSPQNNRVISFEEKPSFSYYIGNMIIESKVFNNINDNIISLPDGRGLIALFQECINRKTLYSIKHAGLQLTFNTLYQYRKAETDFIKFFTEQGDINNGDF